jgi:hypothetical protein
MMIGGKKILESLAFIFVITVLPSAAREMFQNLPFAYIKLA